MTRSTRRPCDGNIRPIKTEADHRALGEIAAYFEKQPSLGTPEAGRIPLRRPRSKPMKISTIPCHRPDPVEAIKAHMEMSGRTRQAPRRRAGSAPRASEILNRRRALTLEMAYRLNRQNWAIAEVPICNPIVQRAIARSYRSSFTLAVRAPQVSSQRRLAPIGLQKMFAFYLAKDISFGRYDA